MMNHTDYDMEGKMIFYVDPMGKPRMTVRDKWKKRPVVLRYYAFKDSLKEQAKNEGFILKDRLRLNFYIPMPQSWSKKKRREMFMKPHQQKPDIDNLVKAFLDSLYEDDSCVHTIEAKKVWYDMGHIMVWDY